MLLHVKHEEEEETSDPHVLQVFSDPDGESLLDKDYNAVVSQGKAMEVFIIYC